MFRLGCARSTIVIDKLNDMLIFLKSTLVNSDRPQVKTIDLRKIGAAWLKQCRQVCQLLCEFNNYNNSYTMAACLSISML